MYRDKTGDVIVSNSDEDAIRDIELRFNEAWGQHDPDGMIESLVDMLSSLHGQRRMDHDSRRLPTRRGASTATMDHSDRVSARRRRCMCASSDRM
jgi:hypothetical protein